LYRKGFPIEWLYKLLEQHSLKTDESEFKSLLKEEISKRHTTSREILENVKDNDEY